MQDKKILDLQIKCGNIRKNHTRITQKEISEHLHISMNTIGNFEKGKHKSTDLLLFYIKIFMNSDSFAVNKAGNDLLNNLMVLIPDFKENNFMED